MSAVIRLSGEWPSTDAGSILLLLTFFVLIGDVSHIDHFAAMSYSQQNCSPREILLPLRLICSEFRPDQARSIIAAELSLEGSRGTVTLPAVTLMQSCMWATLFHLIRACCLN
jgi:hypothetical protein